MENNTERICHLCGQPAKGYASIWTADRGELWYCHGDDEDESCYERAPFPDLSADHAQRLIDGPRPKPLVIDLNARSIW